MDYEKMAMAVDQIMSIIYSYVYPDDTEKACEFLNICRDLKNNEEDWRYTSKEYFFENDFFEILRDKANSKFYTSEQSEIFFHFIEVLETFVKSSNEVKAYESYAQKFKGAKILFDLVKEEVDFNFDKDEPKISYRSFLEAFKDDNDYLKDQLGKNGLGKETFEMAIFMTLNCDCEYTKNKKIIMIRLIEDLREAFYKQ